MQAHFVYRRRSDTSRQLGGRIRHIRRALEVPQQPAMSGWYTDCRTVSGRLHTFSIVVRDSQCGEHAPREQCEGQLDIGGDSLQEQSGWQFGDDIADVKQRDARAELLRGQPKLLAHASGIGVSGVAAVLRRLSVNGRTLPPCRWFDKRRTAMQCVRAMPRTS